MLTVIYIVWNSFKMALQELSNNKLRTFLSLFGITIGIFCIIGVLATVESLETKIQSDIKSLGSNTIYIDKWDYGGGPDNPWWKFVKRPYPKYREMEAIKARSSLAAAVCYTIDGTANLEYKDNILNNISCFGVTQDYDKVLTVTTGYGRYISESEFHQAAPVALIGYTNAENLFGSAQLALAKEVKVNGKTFRVAGVIKKQGKSLVGGWQFDEAIIIPYTAMAGMFDVENSNPKIMVKAAIMCRLQD